MQLPNGGRAHFGTKLEDYTLNPLHHDGRNKARVFDSVLGITLANADVLRDALPMLQHILTMLKREATMALALSTSYVFLWGQRRARQL